MVYFANFQHILFLLELTFCTTILVHHVLPYVVVPQECPVRVDETYSNGNPRRVCVSSCFAIRGGIM
jgi:uncharacterized membrane protein